MRKALIVGIDDYPGAPLHGCLNDAYAVASLLETHGDGSPNFAVKLSSPGDAITRSTFRASVEKLFEGDAFEIIDRLPRDQLFDLVFIDGNKERYKDYVVKTEPLLAKNGIMIVDDCFYHGDVLNAVPTDAKGLGTKACIDYLGTCNDWLRIALPLSNGLFMMTRNNV